MTCLNPVPSYTASLPPAVPETCCLRVFSRFLPGVFWLLSSSVASCCHLSWTEPSTRRVSSPPVGLVVGKKPIREWHIRWQIWHSKLLVDGGPDLRRFRLDSQLLNASYFELFYCWLARGMPISSVSIATAVVCAWQCCHQFF